MSGQVGLVLGQGNHLAGKGGSMAGQVKLLINQHNNMYSYTGTSDDNLLENIKLFDKLSLRFSHRVLFIKDVIGSNS